MPPNRMTTEEWVRRATKIHNGKFSYENTVYSGSNAKLTINCPIHGDIEVFAKAHIKGHDCKYCHYDSKYKSDNDFIARAKALHGDKYTYENLIYTGSNSPVQITCNEHGNFTIDIAYYHLRKKNPSGCPRCRKHRIPYTYDEWVTQCDNVHSHSYVYTDLTKNQYRNTGSYVDIICQHHGIFNVRARHHMFGSGCPSCTGSNNEKIIANWLTLNEIPYVAQWCKHSCINPKTRRKLRFDFMLPNHNILIEYDGEQHHTQVDIFGDISSIKQRDTYKNEWAKTHGMTLIRIPYTLNPDTYINILDTIINQ